MKEVTRFATGEGRSIYGLPIEVFPSFVANVYVISDGERRTLVDCGSGFDQSNYNLTTALATIEEEFGERVSLSDIDTVLITHGHIDHFGALPFVRQHTDAPIGVHILDHRVLSHYEERVIVASKQLDVFLERAGTSPERRASIMQMYLAPKGHYQSVQVQFSLEEQTPLEGGIRVHHVPGHCPGQVCLQIDDILLTADHVLSRITPHQSPESITLNMGLGHYLDSLAKIKRLPGIRLALGGHEDPIDDLPGRIGEIRRLHVERLTRVLEICREPRSIVEVSQELFGKVDGYTVLLALEEAGAHIEYLYQRGELIAANIEEIEATSNPVIRYRVE